MPVNFTETDQANVDQPKDANETLTGFERGLLIQLGFFDTVEHSWATEIGEYDETQQEFVMSDEQYLTRFPVSERLRIKNKSETFIVNYATNNTLIFRRTIIADQPKKMI